MVWAILSGLISPIMIIINILLIYALQKTEQLQSVTNKLIALMSVSDVCVGMIVMPLFVIMLTIDHIRSNCTYQLSLQYLSYTFGYISFFLLIAIAGDRYLHIIKLKNYNLFMNNFKMKIILLVIFCGSNGAALITIFVHSFYYQLVLNILNLSGIICIYTMYARVLRKLHNQSGALKKSRDMALNQVQNGQQIKESKQAEKDRIKTETLRISKELAVSRTVRLLLGAVIIFLAPYNVTSLALTYYLFLKETNPSLVVRITGYFSVLFLFSNGIANSTIFICSNRKVKSLVCKLFRYKRDHVRDSDTETTDRGPTATEGKVTEKAV